MSHWLEERRKDDEMHSAMNRKAAGYDRVAAELASLRLTDAEQEEIRRARDGLLSGIKGYDNEFANDKRRRAAVLNRLLDRLGGAHNA